MVNANGENLEFLTSTQAAGILGVSLRTVQLWVEAGTLRAWKTVGGHRRIMHSSVQEVLDKRRQQLDLPDAHKQIKLMVVEEDAQMRDFLIQQLQELETPVEVVTADNGFEGLLQMGSSKPDLAIIDLKMPGMDGFEMIRALSKTDAMRSNQLIVVTLLDDDEIARHGGLPEGVTVLNKPITPENLNVIFSEKAAQFKAVG